MIKRRPSRLGVAWTAGRLAGRRLLRRTVSEHDLHLGEELTDKLDQMKGLAMKVGQIVSYMEVPLPEPVKDKLAALQTGNTGMPIEQVRARLESALGRSLEDAFTSFESTPIAAASIGQVHRAQIGDTPVAVKVQYPDVADSFRNDLRSVGHLASLASLASAVDGTAIVEELGDRLTEECDYVREAAMQRTFASAFADDPDVHVPEVVDSHCGPTVLTSRWVSGIDYTALESTSAAHRTHVAETLIRFSYRSLWQLGLIQADPHPGNFIFPPDHGNAADRPVTFVDFGCVRQLDASLVEASRAMFEALAQQDRPRFAEAARAMGVVGRPKKFDYGHFFATMEHLHRPLLREHFEFDPDYMREAMAHNGPTSPNALHMAFPPAYIWVSRLQWGLWSILARLRVRGSFRELATEILARPVTPPPAITQPHA